MTSTPTQGACEVGFGFHIDDGSFGDVSLDHLLVEYISDNMVLLQSGCLCCTMRGDLVDALETLLRDLDNNRCKFRRLLLETTGLADPGPGGRAPAFHPHQRLRGRPRQLHPQHPDEEHVRGGVRHPESPVDRVPAAGRVETWSEVHDVRDGIVSYTNHYAFASTGEELLSPTKLRFRTLEELTRSLAGAGFAVERVYGDWDRRPAGSTTRS